MRVLLMRFGVRPVVSAIALLGVLTIAGCASNNSSSSGSNATATPTFSPGAGTFNASQTVTIATTTPGAVLYCTTDGTMPTTSSPQCSQPTTVFKSEFLQAIAVVNGMAPSAVASAGYTINLNATPTPTFNPAGGSYTGAQNVTISDTAKGANIYYTLDGSVPTVNSTLYTGPVAISKSSTLSAIATATGFANSGVQSATYVVGQGVATPVITPAGGTFNAATPVTITDATAGAVIYYTVDGSAPSSSSTPYIGAISVSANETINAIAVTPNGSSSVATASFTISVLAAASPTFSPAAGTFTSTQTVMLSDTTPSATIFYTVDGSMPTTSSPQYNGTGISVAASETIKAIATAPGFSASAVSSAAYTINVPAAASPTFSPAAGTFTSTQTVMLSDTTPSATIFYTVDGSMPTTSSPQYNGTGISVAASETIKTIATAPGFSASAVSSAAYTINVTVAPPTFSPAAGTYTAAQTVALSDATPGATIYFTTDGTPATTSSTVYNPSSPITVSSPTETINAIATLGSATSTIASAAYTINLGPSYSGVVMSGTLPVNGAKVQMYAAGQSGYGSSATLLTTTAVTTGSDGSFTLNYNCPSAPGDLVYLIATGGSTGTGGSNSALSLMTALGACNGTLPKTAVINEATTVASAYALSQFMTSAANVGSSAANYEKGTNTAPGLANAFATVKNLVDLTTGKVLDHTPDYPTNLTGDPNILNNSTVPQARIDSLANTLNACAAAGTNCSSLFNAATPISGTTPQDTLQAILNIAQNPGNNVAAVYSVTAGTGPFTPALSAAPNDWTLALTFTGGGLGFAPGHLVTFAPPHAANGSGQFLNGAMAIDATGNIWVSGYNFSSILSAPDLASGMITQFSNLGAPLTPPSSLSSGQTAYGGYIPLLGFAGNSGTLEAHGISFDPSGNAWVIGGTGAASHAASSPGAMTEISPSLSVVLPNVPLGNPSASPIAIDGLSNIWTFGSDSSGTFTVDEFDNKGNLLVSNNGLNQGGNQVGYFGMQALIFDSNASALWSSDPNALTVYQINPKDGSNTSDYFNNGNGNGYTPLVAASAAPDGSAGNVYGCEDPLGQTLDVFNVSSTSILNSYPVPTGRGCGAQMVMDGAGHIFTVTGSTGSTLTPGILDEFSVSSSGISLISPTTGYTGTGAGESPTINPDPSAPLDIHTGAVSTQGVAGAAIDGSGNLWVLNVDSGTTTSPGNALVEFIGIAAPVVTPTSLAIQFGQVGVRP